MATMRMRFHRVEPSWIALLLSGVLVGAALVIGITQLQTAKPQVSAPAAVAPPALVSETAGGRLGGIASSDTANDWRVKQSLGLAATLDQGSQTDIIGGRLGGAVSADTANDAAAKASSHQIAIPDFGFVP